MWTDPKTIAQWLQRFKEVQTELDEIEIPEPLTVAPGEILESTHELNRAFLESNRAFKELGAVKDKCRRLAAIAERKYKQKKADAILEAGRDRDRFPSAELRKAYGEIRAKKYLKLWQAASVLSGSIHDERSRLFQYREDLEQIGHNVRQEIGMK